MVTLLGHWKQDELDTDLIQGAQSHEMTLNLNFQL